MVSYNREIKKIRLSSEALKDSQFIGDYISKKSEGARAILLVIDDDSSKYSVSCEYSSPSIDVTEEGKATIDCFVKTGESIGRVTIDE